MWLQVLLTVEIVAEHRLRAETATERAAGRRTRGFVAAQIGAFGDQRARRELAESQTENERSCDASHVKMRFPRASAGLEGIPVWRAVFARTTSMPRSLARRFPFPAQRRQARASAESNLRRI